MNNCNQRPFTADEAQHDPHLETEQALPRPQMGEASAPPASEMRPSIHPHHATGEHRPIRATGTDESKLEPIDHGYEIRAESLRDHEPEDRLPDQLDHNK